MTLVKLVFISVIAFISTLCIGQTHNPIFRYPDISDKHIVFSFANDLWLVEKNGGTAIKLSSPPGLESWARFSPDGKTVAFTGNYDGLSNVYTISIDGGLPTRLTYHSMGERVVDWTPDGQHIIYASSKKSGKQRFNQFYKQPVNGGLSEKLPIAHAENGSVSPDGKQIVFTDKSRLYRTWKRYRGGTAADVHIFNLETYESKNITNVDANCELPMWCDNAIYYLSDRGDDMRFNIWKYSLDDERHVQVTAFDQFDVQFPAAGPNDIVFEAGGDLYTLSLANDDIQKVNINIIADFDELKPRQVEVSDYARNASVSPNGKRIVVEARGELYDVPKSNGATRNISQKTGSAERYPAWSPDGKYIAYWSDEDGEYNLYLFDYKNSETKKITSYTDGYRYQPFWSPDSKKLAFIDQALQVAYVDIESGKVTDIYKQKSMNHYALDNFVVDWSADSRYIAMNMQRENEPQAVLVYDTEESQSHTIGGGLYDISLPEFDPQNRYIYVLINNAFSPIYSGFDNSWVYANNTRIAAFTLTKDQVSPLAPKNDVALSDDAEEDEKSSESDADKDESLSIDFDGIEKRMVLLPLDAGNYSNLIATEDKLIFIQYPKRGVTGQSELKYYDLKKREDKKITDGISKAQVTANGKKLLVSKGNSFYIIEPSNDQSLNTSIDLSGMRLRLDPREEWQQLFNESWRIQRDYFYDRNMHGLDWLSVKEHYQTILDRACSRSDVNYVIGELIGELNASHAYRSGGERFEESRSDNIGYLGIDWGRDDTGYFIDKIILAADWDTEVRSPFAEPGIEVQEGDYIISVNGMDLSSFRHPNEALSGLAASTVELIVKSRSGNGEHKAVYVKTLRSEDRLRNLAWIEANRQYVDSLSDGKIGYVYVPSTGMDGQYELVRMFYGQYKKPALIIDERFNNGGQIPDRFIELLDRKPLAYWKTRDGMDWQWPPVAHFGPKAMLINGWSGSGGDAFPDYFRKAGLGPLIGTRTWGGLIGISGTPPLIDGGNVTAPTFRMFHPDGEWFPEGHGVDPDIEVTEDYTSLAKGIDAQLKKAVEVLMNQLEDNPCVKPEAPAVEKRTP